MVTIQSQNFGVEIEMTGVSRGTAASVIANYFGVGGIHFTGGTYQTYEAKDSKGRVWKCMRDGSITPRRRRGGAIVEADDTYRCEVVTPILQYEDITDLQEVIRALVKKGAMANSSCGIHVHVDGANHTPESLCRLLNFATGRQDLFYEALQIGSRADHWCHKINPALFREMKKNGRASRNDAERIWYSVVNDGYDGGVDSSHYNSTRYHGINLHAYGYGVHGVVLLSAGNAHALNLPIGIQTQLLLVAVVGCLVVHTVRDGGGQPSLVVLKGAAAPEYAHVFHADLLEMCQLSVCIIEAGDGSNGGCHKIIVVHSDDSFPRDKAPARMSAGKDDFIRSG